MNTEYSAQMDEIKQVRNALLLHGSNQALAIFDRMVAPTASPCATGSVDGHRECVRLADAALDNAHTADPVAQMDEVSCPECGTRCMHRAISVSDDVIHEYTPIAAHHNSPDAADSGRAMEASCTHDWQRLYTGTGRWIWECRECFKRGGECEYASKNPEVATHAYNHGYRTALAAQGQGERKSSPEHQTEMLMARMVLNQVVVPPASSAVVPDSRRWFPLSSDSELAQTIEHPGYDTLWVAFGLSHASWLTMPRAFMHAMPDVWQAKMAELINEWGKTWEWPEELGTPIVSQQVRGRFTPWPEYVLNYRHPHTVTIDKMLRLKLLPPTPSKHRG